MKILIALTVASLTLSQFSLQAAQNAAARLYCLSIRFGHASAGGQNALYSLDLTGIGAGINGELFPISDTPPTHESFLVLTDDISEEQIPGDLFLDVPTTDNNGDGFPDIFDSSQPFSGSSSGTYDFGDFGSGNVTATWSRDAGSQDGSCRLDLKNFGEPFYHTFTILEYKGPLSYTPGTNTVSGNVDLALTGAPDAQLHGPIVFTKSSIEPHDQLTLEDGSWTNNTEQIYTFFSYSLFRDTNLKTNFYGGFEFQDGDPNTGEDDYYYWELSIDDINDADSDGIPDFSDDPKIISARAPLLSLNHSPGNLSLTISGEVGQVCEIQDASSVNSTNWTTLSSVTLTNDPQIISLPLPGTATRFWRVHTP